MEIAGINSYLTNPDIIQIDQFFLGWYHNSILTCYYTIRTYCTLQSSILEHVLSPELGALSPRYHSTVLVLVHTLYSISYLPHMEKPIFWKIATTTKKKKLIINIRVYHFMYCTIPVGELSLRYSSQKYCCVILYIISIFMLITLYSSEQSKTVPVHLCVC